MSINSNSKFVKYNKIRRFADHVYDITNFCTKNNVELPICTANWSEKIHGTNAAFVKNSDGSVHYQSRKRIITVDNDNADCALVMEKKKDIFLKLIDSLNSPSGKKISLYMEYCGDGIQSNSCVANLSKRFILFPQYQIIDYVKVEDSDGNITSKLIRDYNSFKDDLIPQEIINECNRNDIFLMPDVAMGTIELSFVDPKKTQLELDALCAKVVDNSYIANNFGKPENIGEGVVVTFMFNNSFRHFKVTGNKHIKHKKKIVVISDDERNEISLIANKLANSGRLEQYYDEANDIINGGVPTNENIGVFLKGVLLDIKDEESIFLSECGVEWKKLNKAISKIARDYFFDRINSFEL